MGPVHCAGLAPPDRTLAATQRKETLVGEFVRLERSGAIATIRLDRPPMNAIDAQLREELHAAVTEAGADETIRAVVVYGGEKVFAAGADIKQMVRTAREEMQPWAAALSQALTALASLPVPVVAAINGYALGGGCELALACDWRVASAEAKLGQPEISIGVIPGAGGTQRLTRLVGPARAKDLVFSGRLVDAAEALAIGLVDQVVPAGESVYDAAVALVQRYVDGPRRAIGAAKRAIDEGLDLPLAQGLALETRLFVDLFGTEDQVEGMTAFIEKRRPRFTGR
jgi:cyclohexa-1,5-dienecarbonyl-CoA hydratase